MIILALMLAGGLGAATRFLVDGLIHTRLSRRFPVATMIINVTGSFMLGLVTALALGQVIDGSVRLVIGTGFLGGYTTFSTASFETVRLVELRRLGSALAYGLGSLLLGVAAAALGYAIGS